MPLPLTFKYFTSMSLCLGKNYKEYITYDEKLNELVSGLFLNVSLRFRYHQVDKHLQHFWLY